MIIMAWDLLIIIVRFLVCYKYSNHKFNKRSESCVVFKWNDRRCCLIDVREMTTTIYIYETSGRVDRGKV